MQNHSAIFGVLSRNYRNGGISVRYAPYLTRGIISGARLMVPKSFFRSWKAAIPEAALTHENTFAAFRSTILLAGPSSATIKQFWDGAGNFLIDVSPGMRHSTCGYADLSFTVVLSDAAYSELKPQLEDPTTRMAAEREANRKLAERLKSMRHQATGGSVNPPAAKDADLRQATILAKELLAGHISQQEIFSEVGDFVVFHDDEPLSYSTHDLALSVALKFFTQPERIPQLFQAQLLARMKALQWHREGLVATTVAKNFEEALYELYKPDY